MPETGGPALLVTEPQPTPAFTFTAATLPLTGTAADASGVQAVAWANDRGGSGPATGTTARRASQAEVLVTYLLPDTTAPTVVITFPTDAQEVAVAEPQVNLSGEADDDRAVSGWRGRAIAAAAAKPPGLARGWPMASRCNPA